jgi:hypothetical protein
MTLPNKLSLLSRPLTLSKQPKPSTGSLANFTFAVNGDAIEITGAKEDGAKNNDFKLTSTGDVQSGAAVINAGTSTAGVTEVRGEYSFEIGTAFEKAGATLNIAGQTFTSVASGARQPMASLMWVLIKHNKQSA